MSSLIALSTSPFCSSRSLSAALAAPSSGPTPRIARSSAWCTKPAVTLGATTVTLGARPFPTRFARLMSSAYKPLLGGLLPCPRASRTSRDAVGVPAGRLGRRRPRGRRGRPRPGHGADRVPAGTLPDGRRAPRRAWLLGHGLVVARPARRTPPRRASRDSLD